MTISFDGNVYTGKTTLINSLARIYPSSVIISEYRNNNEYLRTHCYIDGQLFFLKQEKQRINIMYNSKGNLFFLDRSIFSILSHTYAIDKLNDSSNLIQVIEYVGKMVSKNEVILPDLIITIRNNRDVYTDILNKGTQSIYFDNKYRGFIDEFFSILESAMSNAYIINNNDTAIVLQLINNYSKDSKRIIDYNEFFNILSGG